MTKFLVRKEDTTLGENRFFFSKHVFNSEEAAQHYINEHCPQADNFVYLVVEMPVPHTPKKPEVN